MLNVLGQSSLWQERQLLCCRLLTASFDKFRQYHILALCWKQCIIKQDYHFNVFLFLALPHLASAVLRKHLLSLCRSAYSLVLLYASIMSELYQVTSLDVACTRTAAAVIHCSYVLHVCMNTRVLAWLDIRTCTYIHTHTCMHARARTHTHTFY